MAINQADQERPKPGARGARTRARLMEAARAMLKSASPIELTAISVSRIAGTAPPSFYVYFADTRDLLLALSEEASQAMQTLGRHFQEPLWATADVPAWAVAFVEDFVATWGVHCEVLAIRNLEADRGDPQFDEQRVQSSLPVLNGLTNAIMAVRPETAPRVEAFAEAVVSYASLERIATIEHTTQAHRIQPHHYKSAIARIISAAITRPSGGKA